MSDKVESEVIQQEVVEEEQKITETKPEDQQHEPEEGDLPSAQQNIEPAQPLQNTSSQTRAASFRKRLLTKR